MLIARPYHTYAEYRERLTAALGLMEEWHYEIEAALAMPDTPESAYAWSLLLCCIEEDYRDKKQMPAVDRRRYAHEHSFTWNGQSLI